MHWKKKLHDLAFLEHPNIQILGADQQPGPGNLGLDISNGVTPFIGEALVLSSDHQKYCNIPLKMYSFPGHTFLCSVLTSSVIQVQGQTTHWKKKKKK